MKVIFKDYIFRVDFEYGIGDRTGRKYLQNIRGKPIATHCFLSLMKGKGDYQELSYGKCVRTSLDTFKKSVGRKLSLSNATTDLKKSRLLNEILKPNEIKELQRFIWTTYFTEHPKEAKELDIKL